MTAPRFIALARMSVLLSACSSLPEGVPGERADLLAREMTAAVNVRAWDRTGAVRWRFAGNRHLWDRRRGFARVEWSGVRALLDLERRSGRAFEEEVELTGDRAVERLDAAHARWTNDAFWLNPVVKVFDPGTVRERVIEHGPLGERGLIVRFTSGGRTPGDAYLFWVGGDGTPVRWQMWTSNLPIEGMEVSWEGWIPLSTGARISTKHQAGLFELQLIDVEGASTLGELEPAQDPFGALSECRDQPGLCASF